MVQRNIVESDDLAGAHIRPHLFFNSEYPGQLNAIVFLNKLMDNEPSEQLCWFIEACRPINPLLLPQTLQQVFCMLEKDGRWMFLIFLP